MKNKIRKYKTIKGACKKIGFEVEVPSRYKVKEVSVISNKILEIKFSSVVARKAKTTKNKNDKGIIFSGAYPNDCYKGEFRGEDISGYEYWNGSAKKPKAYLATWDNAKNKYSYSVYAPRGIKLKAMAKWQKIFK